jgi:transposase-like protein
MITSAFIVDMKKRLNQQTVEVPIVGTVNSKTGKVSFKKYMVKCPNCKSKNLINVEYAPGDPYRYDGISEIACRDCKKRYGRWTGKELKKEEQEAPYGKKELVTSEPRHYNL